VSASALSNVPRVKFLIWRCTYNLENDVAGRKLLQYRVSQLFLQLFSGGYDVVQVDNYDTGVPEKRDSTLARSQSLQRRSRVSPVYRVSSSETAGNMC